MNDEKPEWYTALNPNEKRIIDIFLETGSRWLISRARLDQVLCKTGLMDQHTLTDRLNYLRVQKYLRKFKGKKGAVFYAPRPLIDMVMESPVSELLILTTIDGLPPKRSFAFPMPMTVKIQNVSDERYCEGLIRATESWERVGVGSKKEKEAVYRELRRRRKELVRKAQREREEVG